jgi:hypothetical protein
MREFERFDTQRAKNLFHVLLTASLPNLIVRTFDAVQKLGSCNATNARLIVLAASQKRRHIESTALVCDKDARIEN